MSVTLVRADFERLMDAAVTTQDDADPESFGLHLVKLTTGGGSPTVVFLPDAAALPNQGVTHGYLTLDVVADIDSGSQAVGLCCLLSQRNLLPGDGGTGYSLELHPDNGQLSLRKLTNGLGSGTLLATTTVGGSLGTLALFWLLGPAAAWVLLLGYVDATLQLSYQDFASPYSTSVSEGGFYSDGGSGLTFDILYLTLMMRGPV